MSKKYHKVAVGGTFDHLHKGHHHLLQTAIDHADELVIGVTSDDMVKNKVFTQSIEPHGQRVQSLNNYLAGHSRRPSFTLVPLADPFGPTLSDQSINALVVTQLTLPGAIAINHQREAQQLPPLAIEVTELIKDQSGQYISSTRIRQGAIDRQGNLYLHCLQNNRHFSAAAKASLKSPQGRLIKTAELAALPFDRYTQIALLGDQVTEYFTQNRLPFNYAVIDHKINRRFHQTDLGPWQPSHRLVADNPAGTVSLSATSGINHLVSQPSGLLEINGEEDLLGFPLVLCLPLNSLMLYGQPGEGVVMITVTEAEKNRLARVLTDQPA